MSTAGILIHTSNILIHGNIYWYIVMCVYISIIYAYIFSYISYIHLYIYFYYYYY